MTQVVDTSIVIQLLSARTEDELLRQGFARPVHAPHLLDAEVASVIRGLAMTIEPDKRISIQRAQEMIADYAALRVVRHPMKPLHGRVFELRDNFTSYDAMYVALAEAMEVPLLTADRKHRKAPDSIHRATVHVYPDEPTP